MIEPRWRRNVQIGLLVMITGLFLYSLLDFLSPNSSAYQPRKMVFLNAAMVVHGVATLVQERYQRTFWLLLASSMLLLLVAILV